MVGMSGGVFPDAAQFRADFDWLVSCPSLLQCEEAVETEKPEQGEELDFSPVTSFLDSKAAYRVGYFAEALWQVWLRGMVKPESLERSIQIREEKRTVGEIDFLYRAGGRLHHLEVALKFYLYFPKENFTGSHLIGPNSADTFEKKRDKLLNHQLPLGRDRYPEVDRSEIIMKGMIFYPAGVNEVASPPSGLNPAHRRGAWIRESELYWLEQAPGAVGGSILDKPFWLSGVPFTDSLPQLARAVRGHFAERRHPLVLSLKTSAGAECHRVFVVPDEWPGKL